ncbi:hypothetical protein B0T25DRAFT_133644 [Lasiosphaeria hispida]|uniref:Uncharacterized protein n=1 Tax=Lasiosphaeria hispida TaxID=260671 RepID=A0AAJ0HT47_9PEZI|nr:hypothetical protein B0T25DRAFT_133644 [Lasiosphaeria hispida]
MEFPRTEEEAKDHIMRIREAKGLGQSDVNMADLEAALLLFGEQLYQKSTHFLLELIQNSDDCSYENSKLPPELRILYENKRLLLTCNEDGFTKENVEAICRIGRSTKTRVGGRGQQMTGEKGVGSKSVFKVADVVWIRSGNYSFKFDRGERLGMIAPIWTEFPMAAEKNCTSILLEVSKGCNEPELIEAIRNFDHRSLVFLRRLKALTLSVAEQPGKAWESTVTRLDEVDADGGQETVHLQQDGSSQRYLIARHALGELPYEPKRSGLTEPEIRLAFPIARDGLPHVVPQQVYAFLPIRDYGFKFLLQADFILTANREGIDRSSAWNHAILKHLPAAILKAIRAFNSRRLCYIWPRYLQLRPPMSDFFAGLNSELIRLLSEQDILESAAGGTELPSRLQHVPEQFRDSENCPLTLCKKTQSKYLSPNYDSEDWLLFQSIGVKEMTVEGFIQDVRQFVEGYPDEFRAKSCEWHSNFAQTFSAILVRRPTDLPAVKSMEIVPLRDGQWVAPCCQALLFPTEIVQLRPPRGLPISEVHPDAQDDVHRQQLLRTLGVNPFQPSQVCEVIAEVHANSSPPQALDANDLISHALYMFRTNWQYFSKKKLWFVTEDGTLARGHDLYISVNPKRNIAEFMFPEDCEGMVKYLHRGYLDTVERDERQTFVKWVTEIHLTLEFLRANWAHYGEWMAEGRYEDQGKAWKESRRNVVTQFQKLEVNCRDGTRKRLIDTAIPLAQFFQKDRSLLDGISFIDITNPDDPSWVFLTDFGVVGKQKTDNLIDFLSSLQGSETSVDQIRGIYRQVYIGYTNKDLQFIQSKFDELTLVYVPAVSPTLRGSWYSPSECIWEGGQHLRKTPLLKTLYPDLRDFFYTTLQVGDGTLATAMDELHGVGVYDALSYVSGLFQAIDSNIQRATTDPDDHPLPAELRVFPITNRAQSGRFDYLATGLRDDIWFIMDRHYLHHSFKGVIPLLAFSVDNITQMGLTLNMMGVEDRLLLNQITETTSISGNTSRLNPRYTVKLRRKA